MLEMFDFLAQSTEYDIKHIWLHKQSTAEVCYLGSISSAGSSQSLNKSCMSVG